MTVHGNSIQAYHAASATLRGRKLLIITALHAIGHAVTDRELAAHLGMGRDGSQPRVSDLIADGVLIEVDRVACPITGHMVRRVWFAVAVVPQEVSA